MSVYDDIFEHLQDAVDCGELPEEFAEAVNDLAYDKYEMYLEDGGHPRKKALNKPSKLNTEKHLRNSERVNAAKNKNTANLNKNFYTHPVNNSKGYVNKLIQATPSKKQIIKKEGPMSDREISAKNISGRKRQLSYNEKEKMIRDAAEARKRMAYGPHRKPNTEIVLDDFQNPVIRTNSPVANTTKTTSLSPKKDFYAPATSRSQVPATIKHEVDTPLKEYKQFPWINVALGTAALATVGGISTGIISKINSGNITDANVTKHVEKVAIPKLENELAKFTTDINSKINNDERVPAKVTKAANRAIDIKSNYFNSFINELRNVNTVDDYERVVTKYHTKEAGVIAQVNKNMKNLEHVYGA